MKKIIDLLKWIGLGTFAYFMLKYFLLPTFIIGLFTTFYGKKARTGISTLSDDFTSISVLLDILGNVTIFNWTWFIWKTKNGYRFGNRKETISYVLKINQENGTLTLIGLALFNIINTIDKGHFENLTS